MKITTLLGLAGLALAPLLPMTAAAQAVITTPAAAPTPAVAFTARPVDADTLARSRGGTDVHNDMTLHGTTANNSARNVSTGDNSISAGSFANMNGLPIVIQNSGANVLIQNATILHLQMN